jgi:hypothetical protein
MTILVLEDVSTFDTLDRRLLCVRPMPSCHDRRSGREQRHQSSCANHCVQRTTKDDPIGKQRKREKGRREREDLDKPSTWTCMNSAGSTNLYTSRTAAPHRRATSLPHRGGHHRTVIVTWGLSFSWPPCLHVSSSLLTQRSGNYTQHQREVPLKAAINTNASHVRAGVPPFVSSRAPLTRSGHASCA